MEDRYEWFEIVGYDVTMMSLLAYEAGIDSELAYSESYVVRFYFANPQIMSAGHPVHVTELVRLPGFWEYT